ncbi:MAG: ASCH domain-containing protein [Gammaproteobacteria bacterium]|nr:ASCH domain-containing protein [Gammaproteobacteria bacterium]NIM74378.1 ASCH domain-containing protein [Gammaproteobacteria bacterium]NIO26149.1 ASCH domain-containing protein [Gammaproteobacteria bacterium]NIO66763.1 ASCH domain-containing protein [Gammaproteobacteria bacterium]NIP65915.1 ASCH domain-containing protein [Gammaproteobacteria bacterium]
MARKLQPARFFGSTKEARSRYRHRAACWCWKTVLEDGAGKPVCVVGTSRVEIIPFREVDAEFAYDYGEGDRTLESWRETFWRYYSRACVECGQQMSGETLVVCEHFRVVYA